MKAIYSIGAKIGRGAFRAACAIRSILERAQERLAGATRRIIIAKEWFEWKAGEEIEEEDEDPP